MPLLLLKQTSRNLSLRGKSARFSRWEAAQQFVEAWTSSDPEESGSRQTLWAARARRDEVNTFGYLSALRAVRQELGDAYATLDQVDFFPSFPELDAIVQIVQNANEAVQPPPLPLLVPPPPSNPPTSVNVSKKLVSEFLKQEVPLTRAREPWTTGVARLVCAWRVAYNSFLEHPQELDFILDFWAYAKSTFVLVGIQLLVGSGQKTFRRAPFANREVRRVAKCTNQKHALDFLEALQRLLEILNELLVEGKELQYNFQSTDVLELGGPARFVDRSVGPFAEGRRYAILEGVPRELWDAAHAAQVASIVHDVPFGPPEIALVDVRPEFYELFGSRRAGALSGELPLLDVKRTEASRREMRAQVRAYAEALDEIKKRGGRQAILKELMPSAPVILKEFPELHELKHEVKKYGWPIAAEFVVVEEEDLLEEDARLAGMSAKREGDDRNKKAIRALRGVLAAQTAETEAACALAAMRALGRRTPPKSTGTTRPSSSKNCAGSAER